MKKVKKLLSLIVAAVMVIAMAVPTFAAAPQTFAITAPAGDHVYEIYQIFTGTYSEKSNVKTLSDLKWGANSKRDANVNVGDAVAETVINDLKGATGTDSEKLAVIKKYADLEHGAFSTVTDGANVNVAAGYYLIKDKNGSLVGKDDTYTLYIVQVVGDTVITPKAKKPESFKKVKDTNDSTGTTTGWQDSADYDIGDDVPFQLTGTVADDYDTYETYKFVFHDKESAGLTFKETSVNVFVDGKQITSGYTVTKNPADGDTFDVTFTDLKTINETDTEGNQIKVHAGSTITVEYTSTLNENAKIGAEGNPNEMHLEYSNNPNDAQGGETGKTPDDKVIVFTYKTVINKVDEKNQPLKGAEFTLQKKVGDNWVNITRLTITDETTFTFTGLDDGHYKLHESKTPEEYNSIADIEFDIDATHEADSSDPKLLTLTGNVTTGQASFATEKDANQKVTGSLTTNIVNKKGSSLPETGGMGTKILYTLGVILVLGAGIVLVTRKRVSDAAK